MNSTTMGQPRGHLDDACMVAGAAAAEPAGHVHGTSRGDSPPPEGTQIHLREPTSKAERRLIRDIQAGVKARDAAMGQLARANRRIATAERGLRQAGMVVGETAPAPAGPKGEGADHG